MEHQLATFDIEVYTKWGKDVWPQARYLVHGWLDVLWTNDIDAAMEFLRESALEMASRTEAAADGEKSGGSDVSTAC